MIPSAFLYILSSNQEPRAPRIPPWPLRIIWSQVFRPFEALFEVIRQPELTELTKMTREDWDQWEPYPFRRDYFPPSERRWRRIRDAILKRRGCAPLRE